MIILDTNVVSELMRAAIARSVGAAIATRNVADYERCGVKILNPWES
ncbi:MAG: hypothetical protein ACKVQA_00320 [Burkholderiales bacterium]